MRVSAEALAAMKAAATLDPKEFVSNYLFRMEPEAFRGGPAASYEQFQSEIGTRIGIALEDVCLVGSGRVGFSLNRDHLLRPFCSESDLDLVIVSSPVFDECWKELHARAEEFSTSDHDESRRFRKTKENVFNGYLRPDQLPLGASLVQAWIPQLAGPFNNPVARMHEVRAWLFKGWEYAHGHYSHYLGTVKGDIAKMLRLRGDL